MGHKTKNPWVVLQNDSKQNYTPRIVPFFKGVSIPFEESHILW